MLAQNLKTAEELQIDEITHFGLIKVLGMLERGELRHTETGKRITNGFNMHDRWLSDVHCKHGCGSACCIMGWVDVVTDRTAVFGIGDSGELRNLFCPLGLGKKWDDIKPDQAAIALRSYLTTGKAHWEEALTTTAL